MRAWALTRCNPSLPVPAARTGTRASSPTRSWRSWRTPSPRCATPRPPRLGGAPRAAGPSSPSPPSGRGARSSRRRRRSRGRSSEEGGDTTALHAVPSAGPSAEPHAPHTCRLNEPFDERGYALRLRLANCRQRRFESRSAVKRQREDHCAATARHAERTMRVKTVLFRADSASCCFLV